MCRVAPRFASLRDDYRVHRALEPTALADRGRGPDQNEAVRLDLVSELRGAGCRK